MSDGEWHERGRERERERGRERGSVVATALLVLTMFFLLPVQQRAGGEVLSEDVVPQRGGVCPEVFREVLQNTLHKVGS